MDHSFRPAAVLDALRVLEIATAEQVAAHTGIPVRWVRETLWKWSREAVDTRRVFVRSWTRESEDYRRYPRPCFKLGRGTNRNRPGPCSAVEYNRAARERAQQAVFDLTMRPMGQVKAVRALAQLRRTVPAVKGQHA